MLSRDSGNKQGRIMKTCSQETETINGENKDL